MMALGFFAGLLNWARLGRREGRDLAFCSDLLFWIMVSGIVGARVAYVISDWAHFRSHPLEIIRVDSGGLIFYGGFFGALLAVGLFARRHHIPARALIDFVATSVPLAHAFGRMGCFLNGCCHGLPTRLPWGITYPAHSLAWTRQVAEALIEPHAPRCLDVHPTQLYEALALVVLFAFLHWAYPRRRKDGAITGLYLLGYAVIRFLVEFLRGDERQQCLGVTVAQAISIAVFVSGLVVLVTATRRKAVSADDKPSADPLPASAGGSE